MDQTGKGDELPREHRHRRHSGWEHLFVVTQRVSRKMEQFPSTHCPRALARVAVGLCPAPLPATSQLPAPPAPEGSAPPSLLLLCEGFSPGIPARPPCPPSSGRRTNNGSFHSHWGREERKSLPSQRLPNRLLFVPSSTWIFPDLK